MNFLGDLQVFFFVFFIFCVRRSVNVLDPENHSFIRTGSGSRALGFTEDVTSGTKSMQTKKEGLQHYHEYPFNSILNIFCLLRKTYFSRRDLPLPGLSRKPKVFFLAPSLDCEDSQYLLHQFCYCEIMINKLSNFR